MESTSVNLLRRVREPSDRAAWQRLVDLYAPLVFHWGKSEGLNATDASDLVQDVLTLLALKLPEFEYDPNRKFRGWLRTLTVNRARDFQRLQSLRPTTGVDQTIASASVPDNVDLLHEAEYRHYLAGRALELMQTEFQEATWRACWLLVIDDRGAAEVARELGTTANAVYLAKSRVLAKLRLELEGLIE